MGFLDYKQSARKVAGAYPVRPQLDGPVRRGAEKEVRVLAARLVEIHGGDGTRVTLESLGHLPGFGTVTHRAVDSTLLRPNNKAVKVA